MKKTSRVFCHIQAFMIFKPFMIFMCFFWEAVSAPPGSKRDRVPQRSHGRDAVFVLLP
jgi:hypothetical protein